MKKLVLSAIFIAVLPSMALGFGQIHNLDKGVIVTRHNASLLAETSMPFSVARSGHRSIGSGWVSGFYHDEESGVVYSISEDSRLFVTRYVDRELLSHRTLIRWENEYIEQEVLDSYQYGMDWSEVMSETNDLMGCVLRAPLRYGDIVGGGKSNLVVLLPNEYSIDWSIFSINPNKIIFSNKLNYTNSIAQSEVPDYLMPDLQGNEYQYWLRTGVESDRPGQMGPALRAYGKIYLGDFDKDGSRDIVLWRKLYQSRKKDDQVQGFILIREKFIHYQLKDGAFQTVDTDESVIHGWLQEGNLTWREGYPSKSECPGQEGELILEMHDPLLNDPDVLH